MAMNTYVTLLRGINVGGKNKVPMLELKECLAELGFVGITTYIASGNVILQSPNHAEEVRQQIEEALPKRFQLDSELIRILVLTHDQLKMIVDDKPKGFGEQPDIYHYDVVFLMGIDIAQALQVFDPREGVDQIWPGNNVIYSQRLSAERTRSRLNKIIGTPAYKAMTIRNWNTTLALLKMLG